MTHARPTGTVLLYPCTLVDYLRLALLAGAVSLYITLDAEVNLWLRLGFVLLVVASSLLDLLDGYLARKLNHTSRFGTLLDLMIDLLTHTLTWTVTGWYFAPVLVIIEWLAGGFAMLVALGPGAHWKTTFGDASPRVITSYFRNNQRNLLSAYGNICHVAFPLALYVGSVAAWVAYLALPGLIIYELVTLYMLYALARAALRR